MRARSQSPKATSCQTDSYFGKNVENIYKYLQVEKFLLSFWNFVHFFLSLEFHRKIIHYRKMRCFQFMKEMPIKKLCWIQGFSSFLSFFCTCKVARYALLGYVLHCKTYISQEITFKNFLMKESWNSVTFFPMLSSHTLMMVVVSFYRIINLRFNL